MATYLFVLIITTMSITTFCKGHIAGWSEWFGSPNSTVTAGSPFSKRRLCTDSVNEGQCFTSVYVTYDDSFVWGLQLMTSDNILFSWLGNSNTNTRWWPGDSSGI
eukprot:665934_1